MRDLDHLISVPFSNSAACQDLRNQGTMTEVNESFAADFSGRGSNSKSMEILSNEIT